MKKHSLLSVCVAAISTLEASAALALPPSPGRIPNGVVFNCENCHPGNDVYALNEFGKLTQGIRHAMIQPDDWWTIMYNVDSDGDGLSNGLELGDPCGAWRVGDPDPAVTMVSNPGDTANWLPTAPNHDCPRLAVAPAPPDPDAPEASASLPAEGQGVACTTTAPGATVGGAGWAALAVGLAGLRVAHARKRRGR